QHGLVKLSLELDMPYLKISGMPARQIVSFDPSAGDPLELKSLLQQELIARGILWSGMHVMSFSHTDEDVEQTLSTYREALALVRSAVCARNVASHLRGLPVAPVFRTTTGMSPQKGGRP